MAPQNSNPAEVAVLQAGKLVSELLAYACNTKYSQVPIGKDKQATHCLQSASWIRHGRVQFKTGEAICCLCQQSKRELLLILPLYKGHQDAYIACSCCLSHKLLHYPCISRRSQQQLVRALNHGLECLQKLSSISAIHHPVVSSQIDSHDLAHANHAICVSHHCGLAATHSQDG